MTKNRSTATNKRHATTLHSRIIRSRWPNCLAATHDIVNTPCTTGGNSSALQCAHIISRRYSATRTDINNGWGLCAGHHRHIDNNPDLWYELVARTVGIGAVRQLRAKANIGPTLDGKRVTATRWWRHEAHRLTIEAIERGTDLDGIPQDLIAAARNGLPS